MLAGPNNTLRKWCACSQISKAVGRVLAARQARQGDRTLNPSFPSPGWTLAVNPNAQALPVAHRVLTLPVHIISSPKYNATNGSY
jgi:hypothetical protein